MSHYDPDQFDPHSFDFAALTRIDYGPGKVANLGALAKELGGTRVLLVTDPGLRAAGHVDIALGALDHPGLAVRVFDGVEENPTTKTVAACVAEAREHQADLFIGFGGGSSIDTAKGANIILSAGGEMRDYWGYGKVASPMLPLIAVPTTAGTGSEVQSFALIADAESHMKMACGDPKAAPQIALLDPELTRSLPFGPTANTGIDAIAHAIESAVSRKRNAFSSMLSHWSYRLLYTSFPTVLQNADNPQARGDMLLGACLAGLAIENSMLGAAHSMANPLTAHFDIIHGQAVGLALPHVIHYNGEDQEAERIYQDLAWSTDRERAAEYTSGAEALARAVERFMNLSGIAPQLKNHGVTEESLPTLAEEAEAQWTRQFNPRAIDHEGFERLYRNCL